MITASATRQQYYDNSNNECRYDDDICIFSPDEYFEVQQLKNYMNEKDINELESPSTQRWIDGNPSRMRTIFKIDTASKKLWEYAKVDFHSVKNRIIHLLDINEEDDFSFEKLLNYFIGPASEIGRLLCRELDISDQVYLEFMVTYCIQCAYGLSSTTIYDELSPLKNSVIMSQADYNAFWHKISLLRQKSGQEIGTGRRGLCLWEALEEKVNCVLRSVSVEDVKSKLSLSVDDDKIWYNAPMKYLADTFSLKITRHVKDNRFGMILHTAATSTLLIPVACTFERVKENTLSCYERIFKRLFGRNGDVDLRNVDVHSDRGYALPSVVFDFLLASGANIVCTTKRFLVCWPFNFGPKQRENDPRTHVEEVGAPTLFLKFLNLPKRVVSGAFRNGSGSVSTMVSSLHHSYEWEGVTNDHGSLISQAYDTEPGLLKSKFFDRVENVGGIDELVPLLAPPARNPLLLDDDNRPVQLRSWNEDETNLLQELLENEIDPLTLGQGSADWHYLRKFSFTSSQTFESFKRAYPLFKEKESWMYIASYVYGDRRQNILDKASDNHSSNQNDPLCAVNQQLPTVDILEIVSITDYVFNLVSRNNLAIDTTDETRGHQGGLELTHAQTSALIIIDDFVTNNKSLSEQQAREKVNELQNNQKAAIREFLITMRFDNERIRGTFNDRTLQNWFMYNNAERHFAFLKADVLKNIMKRKH